MKAIPSVACMMIVGLCAFAGAEERSEHFDREPGWDAHNNRATEPARRTVRQDFGYSRTANAGGASGEIGGRVVAAGEAAYYAAPIAETDFQRSLSASGRFNCAPGSFHLLLGFFNSGAINEWRTPNSIALRLQGRGDKFYAYVEYATARWRAGGDSPRSFPMVRNEQSGRSEPQGFASGKPHEFSLRYDPQGNNGQGVVTATIDDQTAVCHLDAGHKDDGARFNRFGLLTVMKSADDGGEIWVDDLAINDQRFDFAEDPQWDGMNNRRKYESALVRPRFDFGFSSTNFAGGQNPGELGGVVFRGDCRYAERLAWYADRLSALSLDKPLRASGKICLRRGVSDSGVLLGFFDSDRSTPVSTAQDTGLPASFLGISTDAPSREGFYVAPAFRLAGDVRSQTGDGPIPHIYPDGKSHAWTLDYTPSTADGPGELVVTLDDARIAVPVPRNSETLGTRFDRFGIITPWIDGNSQTIFFDDLTYTVRQD